MGQPEKFQATIQKGGNLMAKVSLCTFNVENLFLRYNFASLPPGITSKKAPTADILKGSGYLPPAKARIAAFTEMRQGN